jgi:hypothetical protein
LALIVAGAFTIFGSNHKPLPQPPKVSFPLAFADLDQGLEKGDRLPRIVKVVPVAKPEAPPKAPTNPDEPERKDPCERHGGWKKTFYRHHHEGWKCVYPRRRR